LATIGLASSVTAVEINDNISINGFIDGSWSSEDTTGNTRDNQDLGLDEVELNILVNAGNVSGELHIDDDGNMGSLDLEQVHFTYSFENGLSAQIGAFGSALGFEREDPAGLYTFSRAYGAVTAAGNTDIYNIGNIDAQEYVGEGVRLSYSTDTVSISVAAMNGVGDLEEQAPAAGLPPILDREDNLDFEVAVAFTGIENLAVGAGIVSVNGASVNGAASVDPSIYNINAAYTLDKLLIAGEYSNFDQDTAGSPDLAAWMLLADYDINDKMGIAVRYSEYETGANTESDRFTIAPNYSITESLGAILEYTSDDDNGGSDSDTIALELTYTF
jgi:hypothetical protein